jgi:hypothetical protein
VFAARRAAPCACGVQDTHAKRWGVRNCSRLEEHLRHRAKQRVEPSEEIVTGVGDWWSTDTGMDGLGEA